MMENLYVGFVVYDLICQPYFDELVDADNRGGEDVETHAETLKQFAKIARIMFENKYGYLIKNDRE